ncbi:citrate synthase [Crossiella equi]|uniref:citrate synthase (unknown stereospecificity) n=1 Tax=Crossiella equi TaxID=130796 RepID=A0ABS5AP59_9PSEU|nr:citrate synthase [Crossiella equi]MBP2478364.1 citrate synthase [Crossiella equi]
MAGGEAERDRDYLSTAQAAARLGVKPETLYSYVSRGQLTSVKLPGTRGSFFAVDELDALAGRTGPRATAARAGAVERIRTELTLLDGDRQYYRGRPAEELAEGGLEVVAPWLWHGERTPVTFAAPHALLTTARAVAAALPHNARLPDRLRVLVAATAAADPLRFDLSPTAITRAARGLLAVLTEGLPHHGEVRLGSTLADRLWPRLSPQLPPPGLLALALGLLADHDLAVSTVAARIAASSRADLYAVVSAGLGAMDGQYHGAASSLAHRFLAQAQEDPVAALSEHLRSGNPLPGFGHRFYRGRDPRADVLLARLRDLAPSHPAMAAAEVLIERTGTFPNVDLALALLSHVYDMPPEAGETIFAIARTVGWTAHALEEYREPGLRFRATGVYVGNRPG